MPNKPSLLVGLLLGPLLAFAVGSLAAEDFSKATRARLTKKCPAVIVNTLDGSYSFRSTNPSGFPYLCPSTLAQVRKISPIKKSSQIKLDYSGWWRLAVTYSKSSCPAATQVTAAPVTIFLQLKEIDGAMFGQVCPSTDRFTGRKTDSGLIITSTKMLSEDPATSFCPDGVVERTTLIEFDRGKQLGVGEAVYKIITRCTNPSASPSACTVQYSGSGFREVSTSHFPAVPSNINTFASTCATARTNCVDCHDGTVGDPPKR